MRHELPTYSPVLPAPCPFPAWSGVHWGESRPVLALIPHFLRAGLQH